MSRRSSGDLAGRPDAARSIVRVDGAIVEPMRDLGRPRADLWEVALWEDAIGVRPDGGEIYLVYHVPNEAIVIPETIDAIRAMTGLETDGARSIAKTDTSLAIRQRFLRSNAPVGVPVG